MSGCKEIKPSFYDRFSCIADRCSFTCCKEWKIAVDDATYQNWKLRLVKDVWKQTHKVDGGRVITLNKEKNCPHLNECGLCNLVLSHGEEILSQTCHTFPREEHEFTDRTEYALMPLCPEVIDFLKNEKSLGLLRQMDNLSASYAKDSNGKFGLSDEDLLFELRRVCLEILEDATYSVSLAYQMCFYVALSVIDAKNQGKDAAAVLADCDKALLHQMAKRIASIVPEGLDTLYERNELFLDVTANYQKEGLYERYIGEAIQTACAISEDSFLSEDELTQKNEAFAKEMEKYEALFRNYMISEVYADTLLYDGTSEDFLMKMQWICMEYAVIRHMLFLDFCKAELSYEKLRGDMVVVCRMMGYDEEDIRDYLLNCFDELIWEWGYLSLLMGE